MSQPFELMPYETRVFYSRVFSMALLNMHAVQTGLFDTYLCESDDPAVALRFKESIPDIMKAIKERTKQELERKDEPPEER